MYGFLPFLRCLVGCCNWVCFCGLFCLFGVVFSWRGGGGVGGYMCISLFFVFVEILWGGLWFFVCGFWGEGLGVVVSLFVVVFCLFFVVVVFYEEGFGHCFVLFYYC